MTSCRLCKRKPVDGTGLCGYHLKAKKNLEAAYDQWAEGFGEKMSWKKYLLRIRKIPQTGQWAKEVADFLLLAEETAA